MCIFIIGYGGQVDFIRGSAEGFDGKGKPIIALGSVNPKTKDERGLPSSKIVPKIKDGNAAIEYPVLPVPMWFA